MIDCVHGLGPLHLVLDLWWLGASFLVSAPFYIRAQFKKKLDAKKDS